MPTVGTRAAISLLRNPSGTTSLVSRTWTAPLSRAWMITS